MCLNCVRGPVGVGSGLDMFRCAFRTLFHAVAFAGTIFDLGRVDSVQNVRGMPLHRVKITGILCRK